MQTAIASSSSAGNEGARILLIADCTLPVPPRGYGGTERIVSYLINGLCEKGYKITLMAARGSRIPGRLIEFSDARNYSRVVRGLAKLAFWLRLTRELSKHDIVHSFGRLDYLIPALKWRIPKVITFQNPVHQSQLDFLRLRTRGGLVLTTCGKRMMDGLRFCGVWRPIHNAIAVTEYAYSPRPSEPNYLMFLGRLTPNKGAHIAIRVARKAGIKLILAGNIGSATGDREYFERELNSYIDGQQIEYVGELDDVKKNSLLSGALALLNPVQWEEPFGIVIIEALACGTPVITFSRGEMPHLVRDGITGFICSDENDMVRAIAEVPHLSRAACRHDAESRFDVAEMVDKYCAVYESLLERNAAVTTDREGAEWVKD